MNTFAKPHLLFCAVAATLAIRVFAAPDHDHDHDHAPKQTTTNESHADAHEHGKDEHDHDGHADEVTLSPEAMKQHGVVVGSATRRAIQQLFIAPARVSFNTDAMAHVGSIVTGRVSELKVKLGDVVNKGDVLLIVDSPELGEAQSDFLLKRAAVDTAKPAVQLAKDAFDRAKQLMDQSQGIALAEVQKRESELRTAEGNLRTAEASATAAENKLHLYGMSQDVVGQLLNSGEIVPQYRVLAPLSGQVIEREVTLGELVNPDRDALLVLADMSTLWVIADVPEAKIATVGKNSKATVVLTGMKDHPLEGRVTYIAPALDPNTRSAKARIEVQDPAGVLKPGMFAQATLMPASNADNDAVLSIPEEAVQLVEGAPAVFVPVANEPGTFAKQVVKVGPPTAGMVQVVEGLAEGDALVIRGSFILKAELGKAGAAHQH
jgi:cobalt-zinc-cadmium efflux system membrane fusion protein